MSDIEFKQWCIVELMGHVRVAGMVSEEQRFGSTVGRIDIPQGDTWVTQYFGGTSIYRVTPTTEEIARQIATGINTAPPVGLLRFSSSSSFQTSPIQEEEDGEE